MATSTPERSQSRGRDAFASTGRGGVGNIRQTSVTRAEATPSSPAVELIRGRELGNALPATSKLYSTGRGGAGNIRSPSRSHQRDLSQPPTLPTVFDTSKEDIIRNHIYVTEEAPISTGRGGAGNIQSRSQSRGPALDLNNPNPNSTASPKATLPKDPPLNESPSRPVRGRNDEHTTRDPAKDTSAATAGNGRFTYPPTYQATDLEGDN
ncbi:hypothetical protein AGABI1DRAFT_130901 [Agaricus bisporus var. burnettii JB137-S8]|uniref:Uncharacterized protein n=1 Tax=Agaricus bisporus var. burnettii (strain JB137-S8 / ATCC MYA-4627 / FGSC 10392) TaxID=597362 RepID=K5WNH1_AGABU|nr:uncharacterized protein AGABI1DRAFT_130901 [Agaricus bisporus var. burnettii JB137-S8]EKM76886.1 hypothetical protein AGABI1DRAFT_130901 [Agaricus bisporus var. burnettii JB137-S8]